MEKLELLAMPALIVENAGKRVLDLIRVPYEIGGIPKLEKSVKNLSGYAISSFKDQFNELKKISILTVVAYGALC